ncbi:MAG: 4Fe-4S binding protein [Gracilibacteraceae bacterium]|jgi:hypothetical protein|nr:4Fe-4S binding protein [Gracilibacteraceae bacterium]
MTLLNKLLLITLFLALGYSWFAAAAVNPAAAEFYDAAFPVAAERQPAGKGLFRYLAADHSLLGYAGISSGAGYAGPVTVGVVFAPGGQILAVEVLRQQETVLYYNLLKTADFFGRFKNRPAGEALVLGENIDGVSGATYSARAVTEAVRRLSGELAVGELGLLTAEAALRQSWQLGLPELAVSILLLLPLCRGRFIKQHPAAGKISRIILLLLTLALLGFYLRQPLTIVQIASLGQGNLPQVQTGALWYMLMGAALLPPLLAGSNFYCHWLCPFGALQELLGLIRVRRLSIPHNEAVRQVKKLLLWLVLLLAFLTGKPALWSYEPFQAAFRFSGGFLAFMLLGIALVAALLIPRFWCRTLCPVGTLLDLLSAWRRELFKPKTAQKIGPTAGGDGIAGGFYVTALGVVILSIFMGIFGV